MEGNLNAEVALQPKSLDALLCLSMKGVEI